MEVIAVRAAGGTGADIPGRAGIVAADHRTAGYGIFWDALGFWFDVPDQPMIPAAHRDVRVVDDQREAFGRAWHAAEGQRGIDVFAVCREAGRNWPRGVEGFRGDLHLMDDHVLGEWSVPWGIASSKERGPSARALYRGSRYFRMRLSAV